MWSIELISQAILQSVKVQVAHSAKKFRRLAGFSEEEITELVDVAAQAFAEAQARSAAAAGEPATAAS